MQMVSEESYGRGEIDAIIFHEESYFGRWLYVCGDGVRVRRPSEPNEWGVQPEDLGSGELEVWVSHPERNLNVPALPFPFSADHFNAFCFARPDFSAGFIVTTYANVDTKGRASLDETELKGLNGRHPAVMSQEVV